jgi:gamma-glutamyl-gamma-aminobutyrate hydrolase PuuD
VTTPIIAVCSYRVAPGRITGWRQGGIAVPEKYVDSVFRAGGRPVLLTLPDDGDPAEILAPFDGLMLIGGGDVDPFLYDTEPHERLYGTNRARDLLEIGLAREALVSRLPTLAICRGIQIANVAMGGTLHQHLPDLGLTDHGAPQEAGGYSSHEVAIQEGSRLEEACGTLRTSVASSHHQAVDRVADGFVAVAWSDDGVIEAFEAEEGWFVAVQWHPEKTASDDPAQQGLFDALVERAKDVRRQGLAKPAG